MATTYPTTLDVFPARGGDPARNVGPDVDNDYRPAIVAIETELGTDPSASSATVRARLDQRLTVRKTADQTFSSTVTPANVTDLVFALLSGIPYTFKFTLLYTSAATANGLRVALTTPTFAAGSFSAGVHIWGRANEAAGTAPALATLPVYSGKIIASGGVVASDAVAAANTPYIATIEGIIVPNANGNLQVQAANEVSTANGTVIKAGSYGCLETG